MNAARPALAARARIHAALGEPARLEMIDRLALGDLAPGELASLMGLPSNLTAHHLRVLEDVGLVRRVRSEADRRRTYVRLVPETLEGLMPPTTRTVIRVLFVCSQNSARSQLAEAAWRRASRAPALSAGLHPATAVHPLAVTIGRRHGLSLEKARTRKFEHVARPSDLVVAVCDNAHEQLGGRASSRVHWSVPDPVRVGTEQAFEAAYAEIERRVAHLAASTQP